MRKNLVNPGESSPSVDLRFEVSSFGPRLFGIFRKSGGSGGAITAHIADILGCGEPDLLLGARGFLQRGLGQLEANEKIFARVGADLPRETNFSATSTQEDFTESPGPLPTSPEMWARRKEPLSLDEIKLRQRKQGGVRLFAAVSKPDICVRLARVASRVNALCGTDVLRINELVRSVREWRTATAPNYASPSRPRQTLGVAARPRATCVIGERRCTAAQSLWLNGRMLFWGGQLTEGERRSASEIGAISLSLTGLRHVLR